MNPLTSSDLIHIVIEELDAYTLWCLLFVCKRTRNLLLADVPRMFIGPYIALAPRLDSSELPYAWIMFKTKKGTELEVVNRFKPCAMYHYARDSRYVLKSRYIRLLCKNIDDLALAYSMGRKF